MLDDAIEWKCSLSCYHWDNLTNIGRLGKPKVALLVSLINKQQELDSWSRACRAGGGGGRSGCRFKPPPFWNTSIFWQNVSVKFEDPMLPVSLEYFIIKKNEMENSFNIQSHRNQTFTGDDGFCTYDYDNNEYLAVKYIRFFTNDIIWYS